MNSGGDVNGVKGVAGFLFSMGNLTLAQNVYKKTGADVDLYDSRINLCEEDPQ